MAKLIRILRKHWGFNHESQKRRQRVSQTQEITSQNQRDAALPSPQFSSWQARCYQALQYSYRDRRNRKRDLRALWITRINNASRELGLSYSQLIAGMKAKNINLDRKVLADLAVNNPEAFKAIVTAVKEKK